MAALITKAVAATDSQASPSGSAINNDVNYDSSAESISDYYNNDDSITVEISPVEGYSEIKMLSSPLNGGGGAASEMSPNIKSNEITNSSLNSNESINACVSPSTTPLSSSATTNDEIPQWKRDLIQRRRNNVVRTIGANQSVTLFKIDSHDTSNATDSQQTLSSGFDNSSCNDSSSAEDSSFGSTYQSSKHSINLPQPSMKKTIKHTISVQHQQKSNQQQLEKVRTSYDDSFDSDTNSFNESNSGVNDEFIEGQYTIKNNTNHLKENISQPLITTKVLLPQQRTSQISNIITAAPPIPKIRSSLSQSDFSTTTTSNEKNTSPREPQSNNIICSTVTTKIAQQNITSKVTSETSISSNEKNTSLLLSPTHTITASSNISSSSSNNSSGSEQGVCVTPPTSTNTMSPTFFTSSSSSSSNQLHSKLETVESLVNTKKLNCSPLENYKTFDTNNFTVNNTDNKSCGNTQTFIKNSNKTSPDTNNKYTKILYSKSKYNVNKKMVSAQDINESPVIQTTKNLNHHHHSPGILLDDEDTTSYPCNDDFDVTEELQYGPGIVSKLRVRYLSLALRQTSGKQHSHLDNLRRATSLNNLLDGGGSTGSTNDGSIIDGDTDNESNLNGHYNINNNSNSQDTTNINNHHNNVNNHHQHKVLKNVSWINNQQNVLKSLIKETQNFHNQKTSINNYDDENRGERTDDIDIEKSSDFLYEITSTNKPEINLQHKNDYQYIKNQEEKANMKEQQKQRNGRQIRRGNDSLKRARSVEALLCEKSSWMNKKNSAANEKNVSVSKRTDDEILLVTEKLRDLNSDRHIRNYHQNISDNNCVTIEDKIQNARERLHTSEKNHPPKRLTSIIDDTERPPPDLVKQTLKLFEATANRRGSRNLQRNSNGQIAVKIANYKSIILQEKPPISYPKPPLSPKRTTASSNNLLNKKPISLNFKTKTVNATDNIKKSTSPISPVLNLTKKFSNIEQNTENDMKFKPPSGSSNQRRSIETPIVPTPDVIPRKNYENNVNSASPIESPVTMLTKQIERLKITNPSKVSPLIDEKKINSNSSEKDTSIDNHDGKTDDYRNDSIKHISQAALENISKAGTTQHFSFNNSNKLSGINKNINEQMNSTTTITTTTKQVGVIRPLLAEPKINSETSTASTFPQDDLNEKIQRGNLVISDLSQNLTKTKYNNATSNSNGLNEKPILTIREIQKNLINDKKNELANLENNIVDCGSSPLWHQQLNKKNKTGGSGGASGFQIEAQNNIMVFNFQDRKDVPDYIENDGLLIKRRRELPKSNESGYVLLGDLSLETSTDPDDSWTMGPPSPCNVEFENANVIIDGKSNLRYRSKEVSLRVQFDDTLTSIYEYPSESSMLLEDSVGGASEPETFEAAIESIQHIDADEIIEIPNNKTNTISPPSPSKTSHKCLGNMSLGSAPLGSYTPIKAQIQTNFELGITRLSSANQQNGYTDDQLRNDNKNPSTTNNESASKTDNLTDENVQYLKPVSDDLTVVYSEGTNKTDLLY